MEPILGLSHNGPSPIDQGQSLWTPLHENLN